MDETRLGQPRRWRAALYAGAFTAVFIVATLLPLGHVEQGPVLCPSRIVSGRACVFCGLTRAMVAAAHGQFAQAYHFNPWWMIVAFLFAVTAGIHWRDVVDNGDRGQRFGRWWLRHAWATVVVLASLTILRMLTNLD